MSSFPPPLLPAGLASYPIDTVRRRMMMTSGSKVHYSSSFACFTEVIKNEGVKSLFKVGVAQAGEGVVGLRRQLLHA